LTRILTVYPELPNITVGGGFAGTSGESSSYKYGLFDRTIRGIEIILGNGTHIWASAKQHRDLFYTAAGSCGSLGVITLLEMELIDAKSYVELQYIPVKSTQDAVEVLRKYQDTPDVDYMDGIMYSLTRGVIMLGRLTNTPIPDKIMRFDRPRDPWCYMHAESILNNLNTSAAQTYKESIPIQPYLFRYDRGVFWSGLRAFKYFATPFNALTRWLLDPFMYTRTMVHAMHRSGIAARTIIQDYGIPYDAASAFVEWTHERTGGIWPLWLCPVKCAPLGEKSFSQGGNVRDGILLDVGIWDVGPADRRAFIKLNRDFEEKVTGLGGMKCLYAHAYYTEDEFWGIYDGGRYERLRREYFAGNLMSVWEKVRVDFREGEEGGWKEWFWGTWPFGGLYGVASAAKGLVWESEFLLKK